MWEKEIPYVIIWMDAWIFSPGKYAHKISHPGIFWEYWAPFLHCKHYCLSRHIKVQAKHPKIDQIKCSTIDFNAVILITDIISQREQNKWTAKLLELRQHTHTINEGSSTKERKCDSQCGWLVRGYCSVAYYSNIHCFILSAAVVVVVVVTNQPKRSENEQHINKQAIK